MREKDREKFVELAEKRVNRAIKDMKLIGNLSNKSNYDYTEEDIRKIIKALQNALNDVRNRFMTHGEKSEPAFRLDR